MLRKGILKPITVVAVPAMAMTGSMVTPVYAANGWVKTGDDWMYLQDDGTYVYEGWKKIGSKWYWFDENGIMGKSRFLVSDGKTYWLTSDGSMKTGWLFLSGSDTPEERMFSRWHYFGSDGAMKTGWVKVDGIWYLFYDLPDVLFEGRLMQNYCFNDKNGTQYLTNADGAWAATKYPSGKTVPVENVTSIETKQITNKLLKQGTWYGRYFQTPEILTLKFLDTSHVDIYFDQNRNEKLTAHTTYQVHECQGKMWITIDSLTTDQSFGKVTFKLDFLGEKYETTFLYLDVNDPDSTNFRFKQRGQPITDCSFAKWRIDIK